MKHTIFTSRFITLATTVMLLIACEARREKAVTPSICPSDEFRSSGLLYDQNADFTSENVEFTASFNEEINWTLTITGKISGAVKRFSGKSRSIKETWIGASDTSIFFKQEQCEVRLKFACREAEISTLEIDAVPTFRNQSSIVMVQDFDFGYVKPWGGTSSILPVHDRINTPSDPSPQGGSYYMLSGNSSVPVYYFGAATIPNISIPWKEADQVYFNAFVKSDGIMNSALNVSVNATAKGVGYRKIMNFEGWELVSFKLSDIEIVDARTVNELTLSLESSPDQGTTGVLKFDFILFTYGKPFYPAK